jgi:hypothetical protein
VTTKATAVPAEELTKLTARVLSAYYGLVAEGHPTEWLGGQEIVQWIRRHLPDADVPSESTATKTLLAVGLPHRGRGQPSHQSLAVQPAPPLCPVRAAPPRPRNRGQ